MTDSQKMVVKIAVLMVANVIATFILVMLVVFVVNQATDSIKESGGLKDSFDELWHGEQQQESEAGDE